MLVHARDWVSTLRTSALIDFAYSKQRLYVTDGISQSYAMQLRVLQNCVIDISKNGLRIIVDDQNCLQGIAYLKSDLFAEFVLNENVVTFRIPLSIFTVISFIYNFLECSIFFKKLLDV